MHIAQLLDTVHARQEAFRAARDLTRDRLAPDFSPFAFIAPDEMSLSRLLAWLLDPEESHGQGERFLVAFLARLGPGWDGLPAAGATVRTEAPTDRNDWANRRIDVLVRGAGWTLGIENKPWAADQKDQVTDYLTQLDTLPGPPHGLLYLSGRGAPPSESSIPEAERERRVAAGDLHLWSYADLLPWLQVCKGLCRADRVATFIDEFIGYIQRHFQGVRNMTEREQIITAATQSPERVEAAMQVLLAGLAIRRRLLGRLVDEVEAACKAKGWTSTHNLLDDAWPKITIHYSTAMTYGFTIEFGTRKGRLDYLGWGLRKTDKAAVVSPDVNAALGRSLGKGELTEWWPWHRRTSDKDDDFPVAWDWESDPTPWSMIARGEMARHVIKAAERIHGILAAAGHLPQASHSA